MHAAATEFQLQVIEFSPGLGRRSAHDLMTAVGESSRSFLIRTVPSPPTLHSAKKARRLVITEEEEDRECAIKAPPHLTKMSLDGKMLILVDGIDVGFEEDAGFGRSLRKLLLETKQPILMTCNGSL